MAENFAQVVIDTNNRFRTVQEIVNQDIYLKNLKLGISC